MEYRYKIRDRNTGRFYHLDTQCTNDIGSLFSLSDLMMYIKKRKALFEPENAWEVLKVALIPHEKLTLAELENEFHL